MSTRKETTDLIIDALANYEPLRRANPTTLMQVANQTIETAHCTARNGTDLRPETRLVAMAQEIHTFLRSHGLTKEANDCQNIITEIEARAIDSYQRTQQLSRSLTDVADSVINRIKSTHRHNQLATIREIQNPQQTNDQT